MSEIDNKEEYLDNLLTPLKPSPEHQVLHRLLGSWQMSGTWHYIPGKTTTPVRGSMINASVFEGLFVESKVGFQSWEGSRVIYGYDPRDTRYVAFAISAVSAGSDVEYGEYDPDGNALTFRGEEIAGPNREIVVFQRKLIFLDDNAIDMEISYPEWPPERRLGMMIHMRRENGAVV